MNAEQFLSFADCFAEPMLLVSPDGVLVAANSAACELLQLPSEQLAGRPITDYIQEVSRGFASYLRVCATSREPVIGSLTCHRPDMQTLCHGRALQPGKPSTPILLRCTPNVTSDDDFQSLSLRLETLQQEISRRQQTESKLLKSEAHAQAVLNTAVDGIITIDARGIVQSFNRAAERIFGYRAIEVIGSNVKRLMPAPYSDEHDAYLKNYLTTGQRKIIGIGREVEGLRKDGSTFPLDLSVSEVKADGLHHFTGIVRDISDRKLTEERLRQREEEARQHRERLAHLDRLNIMGEMATGIAHEINQPLTAISNYARACHRLISAGLDDARELLEILDKISTQAQRAGEVIHGLRAFVRKRENKREQFDLNELVQSTVVLAETDARENDFAIKTQLTEASLPVVVEPIQIQQVLLNLIRNAFEAMRDFAEAGETVVINVTTALDDPTTAQVAVIDKGVGISDHMADKLFDPFFTTKPLGTGIGLAISRTIVTSHGGRLWFEQNPDQGISMHFTLPLAVNVEDD